MAEVWLLPADSYLKNLGKEWQLHLLVMIPDEQRAPTMLTMWRIWHAHNEMTHEKPARPLRARDDSW
jgi:hypothetical protein